MVIFGSVDGSTPPPGGSWVGFGKWVGKWISWFGSENTAPPRDRSVYLCPQHCSPSASLPARPTGSRGKCTGAADRRSPVGPCGPRLCRPLSRLPHPGPNVTAAAHAPPHCSSGQRVSRETPLNSFQVVAMYVSSISFGCLCFSGKIMQPAPFLGSAIQKKEHVWWWCW